jgi:hypothetical protein
VADRGQHPVRNDPFGSPDPPFETTHECFT